MRALILATVSAMALSIGIAQAREQVHGTIAGVKYGAACTSFVMYRTLYGVPSTQVAAAGIGLAYNTNHDISFDVDGSTIVCVIDGVSYTAQRAFDVTEGVLDFQ